MRATKAYIASLGTTGLLLAFSASLLVLVGTLFAFDAWPGGEIRDAVESVLVDDDDGDTARVAGPEQVALDAAPAAAAVAAAPRARVLPAPAAEVPVASAAVAESPRARPAAASAAAAIPVATAAPSTAGRFRR